MFDMFTSKLGSISRTGSDTIEGATTYTLSTQYKFVELINDGSGTWYVKASN